MWIEAVEIEEEWVFRAAADIRDAHPLCFPNESADVSRPLSKYTAEEQTFWLSRLVVLIRAFCVIFPLNGSLAAVVQPRMCALHLLNRLIGNQFLTHYLQTTL